MQSRIVLIFALVALQTALFANVVHSRTSASYFETRQPVCLQAPAGVTQLCTPIRNVVDLANFYAIGKRSKMLATTNGVARRKIKYSELGLESRLEDEELAITTSVYGPRRILKSSRMAIITLDVDCIPDVRIPSCPKLEIINDDFNSELGAYEVKRQNNYEGRASIVDPFELSLKIHRQLWTQLARDEKALEKFKYHTYQQLEHLLHGLSRRLKNHNNNSNHHRRAKRWANYSKDDFSETESEATAVAVSDSNGALLSSAITSRKLDAHEEATTAKVDLSNYTEIEAATSTAAVITSTIVADLTTTTTTESSSADYTTEQSVTQTTDSLYSTTDRPKITTVTLDNDDATTTIATTTTTTTTTAAEDATTAATTGSVLDAQSLITTVDDDRTINIDKRDNNDYHHSTSTAYIFDSETTTTTTTTTIAEIDDLYPRTETIAIDQRVIVDEPGARGSSESFLRDNDVLLYGEGSYDSMIGKILTNDYRELQSTESSVIVSVEDALESAVYTDNDARIIKQVRENFNSLVV